MISIFERYGHELHSIPVFFFMRFISREIINNDWMVQLSQMRFCRVLRKCGFGKELYEPFEIKKVRITDHERKMAVAKSNSLKSQGKEIAPSDTIYEVPA